MTLQELKQLGFNNSAHVPFTKTYRVMCGHCEALVLNGIPTHELGCPDAKHECAGCNEIIPLRQRYCDDCSS